MASRLRSPAMGGLASIQQTSRSKFDTDLLRAYVKKLLSTTLQGHTWDPKNRDQHKSWCKEISERVKDRMLEIQPKGFKYIVTTTVTENLGQGGRADMACHWEDSDAVAQEMWMNESIICICLSFAVQIP
ncbi:hypothetical protein FRB97_007319 [Tulasnella sp. 331]|nr:hypothetical protein FRB97_007319 [Tulasnella sp. 331]KAG8888750.1 hypothetical protein FRB98_006878 [Tulasnella sp. 332]